MLGHTRQVSTVGASRKRKERDGADAARPPITTKAEPSSPRSAHSGNRLLAGYLAHEFLTKGTLLGQRWDPVRSKSAQGGDPVHPPVQTEQEPGEASRAYADVAYLLKTDGAHIPGIVNPTQLGRWLQM